MCATIERKFRPLHNVIATAHELSKLLNVEVYIHALKRKLEEHPDYPGLLCVSDVMGFFGIEN